MAYMVWNMRDTVEVFNRFNHVVFSKNPHGFVVDVISSSFDTSSNPQTLQKMRQRANDRIEYENERLASR